MCCPEYYSFDRYSIVIFTATRPIPPYLDEFRNIVQAACTELDVPLHVFVSTDYDIYRMPCVGMFLEFEKNWNAKSKISKLNGPLTSPSIPRLTSTLRIDFKDSFFVGHADGTNILDYGRSELSQFSCRFSFTLN